LKKRYRIHPGIAITAIICLTAIAISAKLVYEESTAIILEQLIIFIIAFVVGVKLRHKLPIT